MTSGAVTSVTKNKVQPDGTVAFALPELGRDSYFGPMGVYFATVRETGRNENLANGDFGNNNPTVFSLSLPGLATTVVLKVNCPDSGSENVHFER